MITKYSNYIKENNSNNQFFKTYQETKDWLDSMRIKKYTINDDLTVDVNGYIDLEYQDLIFIPVQFGSINGNFRCKDNRLTTLLGSPKICKGDIYYNYNPVISLDGLSIYNLKKNIDRKWYQDLNDKIKEDYFDKNLEENPEIISLINFETTKEFKDKWDHLFNANKFDLI